MTLYTPPTTFPSTTPTLEVVGYFFNIYIFEIISIMAAAITKHSIVISTPYNRIIILVAHLKMLSKLLNLGRNKRYSLRNEKKKESINPN